MINKQLYQYLSTTFYYYNKALFNNTLPEPLFIISKLPSVASGVFSDQKWSSNNNYFHEIAFNAELLSNQHLLEFHQTLVHEMVHLWQFEFGIPSRNGYHNKQWSQMMMQIGLMPSSTGVEGGSRTGQKIGDYPLENGLFIKAFRKIKEKKIPYTYNRSNNDKDPCSKH